MPAKPVILFDGVCNLCNGTVNWVISHDPGGVFQFASLQGAAGQKLLDTFQLSQAELFSVVLIQNGKAYTKSTAALLVAKQLGGKFRLLYGFIIVPAFIRDAVYNLVARNRYKWFGKKEQCMVPSASVSGRFLI
jgi:predicted DCC family thiol-disulfide oxidoreductase YuxK